MNNLFDRDSWKYVSFDSPFWWVVVFLLQIGLIGYLGYRTFGSHSLLTSHEQVIALLVLLWYWALKPSSNSK